MYLKALEMQGFKSFPDKTVLTFGEDVTAIVGPNGSGKSNISDAIRWVMGEQSIKGLRGSKMEDVVFGGTAKRKQVGFAQVTLVIDNTEHIFPGMEENEISVTRRYYRSGESEYYINRQSVRLRDVTELFLDTGMGREGYAIIGQGKIDEILSAKSGERREIFEEAAGISRFRHRKEEAEHKLQRTEENLVRINDKIAELELQVEPLRQQAERAKKYLLLRDELRLLEISLWMDELESQKAEERKLRMTFVQAQQERDEARAALDALYAEGERCGEQMHSCDVEAEQLRTHIAEVENAAKEHSAAIAVLETTIAHNEETIRHSREELEQTDERAKQLERQADEQETQKTALASEMTQRQTELEDLLAQARQFTDESDHACADVEALRKQESAALAAAAAAGAEAAAAAAENSRIQQRCTVVQSERKAAEEQLEKARLDAEENHRALLNARKEAAAAANVVEGYALRKVERERKAAAANEEKTKCTVEVGTMEHRIRLLTEMEREYEGFTKAVKRVCQAGNMLSGIHGPVASLMKTDAQYSLAMEIALGAGLQNIVVDREEDARSAIRFLKQRDGGRATFLPLTAIRGEELHRNGVERESGFVGIASRLVQFDVRYQNIFQNLLGKTVIVENLDCGIAMARKYRNAFRIVTLDGQVINRGGSMTGGSTARNAGVLSRAAELAKLRSRFGILHQQLVEAQTKAENAARELTAVGYEMETAETQRRQAEDTVLRLEGTEKQLELLLRSAQEGLERYGNELTVTEKSLRDNMARINEAEQRMKTEKAAAAVLHHRVEVLLAGESERANRFELLSEKIIEKRSTLAGLAARQDAVRQREEDLRILARSLSGDQTQRLDALQGYEAAIRQARTEITERQSTLQKLDGRSAVYRQRLDVLNGERLRLEAERTAKNRAGQEVNDTLLSQEREVSRLEQKLTTSAMAEKQILDRLWEHYGLSHSDAQKQRITLESTAKSTRRMGELKRLIADLGTPNIGAIEEFERVNTRYTYLTDQRDDVEKAGRELEGIIARITEQMTEIFARQFRLLSQSFEETFRELFNGGSAKLELEDESDILGCGIEIKAQPPGKTLKTISLLSGGEKAFVAIALYFSILKIHPTPFCVLDEIEAALDDANVNRYARYMRTLSEKTQFVVITHRRGTMEQSDVLYGVTMQEQGVSKVLTIHLNEMAEELGIQ